MLQVDENVMKMVVVQCAEEHDERISAVEITVLLVGLSFLFLIAVVAFWSGLLLYFNMIEGGGPIGALAYYFNAMPL